MANLAGKTLLITGASRGIGRAIALRAARDGANIAVLGKTDTPNPKLAGTVHDTVRDIERAGGRGLACVCDVRFEDQVNGRRREHHRDVRRHRLLDQQRERDPAHAAPWRRT